MPNKSLIFSGIVSDKNNDAVPGASIYFTSAPVDLPDISILTDNEGRFTLSVPVEGKYGIGVSADGVGSKEIEITVTKSVKPNIFIKLM